jgi:hypothetical protein
MSVVGCSIAQGLNAREVAMKAAQEALDQIGNNQPAFGILLISREFNLIDASVGLTSLLGDIPIWGFNTLVPFTGTGEKQRSIVVALFGGSALRAFVHWMPDVGNSTEDIFARLWTSFQRQRTRFSAALASMDASIEDLAIFERVLGDVGGYCGGCLPAGDYARESTAQVAKNLFGNSSISLALLGGKFRMGVGFAHGWKKTGLSFHADGANGVWLQELDGQMPVDLYSRKFGCQPGQWLSPPQAELLRLYPLGIESPGDDLDVRVCSPLRFEASGKIRLTGRIPSHSLLHLLIGDRSTCLAAVQRAVQQAWQSFQSQVSQKQLVEKPKPLLALVLIDLSWRYLFNTQSQQFFAAIQKAVGDIPIIGAYTLGQIASPAGEKKPQLLNQGIAIYLLGEDQA